MNSLKRIFVTLKAQLDEVADDFENHEAVAGVAIKELEAFQGKTRLHQHRLQEIIQQFETKRSDLNKQAEIWTSRAVKIKDQDEAKALECVKRLLQVQKQMKTIEPELAKAKAQFDQCQRDLADIQAQLHALYTQKEVLSARQNRIQLHTSLRAEPLNPSTGAQAIFKRWEQSVISTELNSPLAAIKDSFADEFEQEESTLELKMLLDELTTQTPTE
ncbi:MAG: PspA/IM30 family protein [Methylomicrobium sp.]|nr:PspA/IM30 family protein [Methylomicrobium sp.]